MENTECATFHLNSCDILFGSAFYNSTLLLIMQMDYQLYTVQ